jgi:probable HAF family extracellular repeat protein
LFSLFLCVVAMATAAHGAVQYTVTDLGVSDGDAGLWSPQPAPAINNLGQVVGWYTGTDGNPHAVLISGGVRTELGSLGSSGSYANRINDSGQVVGGSGPDAVVWTAPGVMQDIGSLKGPGGGSSARDINNNGEVVGGSKIAGSTAYHAFSWQAGVMTDLGAIGGWSGVATVATAINDYGQIVGEAKNGNGASDPFLYSGGAMYDLGTLGGTLGQACDINNSGQVVGYSQNSQGYYRAFLSVGGGPLQDLGTLGGNQALAKAINSSGIIVGLAETGIVIPPPVGPEYVPQAFISDGVGPMQNLNSLIDTASGWTITDATDINDLGQIVGYGTNLSGQSDYVLLTPISTPEPSALALLAAALLGLAAWSLRRPR